MTSRRLLACCWPLAALAITWASAARVLAADAKDLVRQVEIRRTQYGVPHIKGETLEAAAFGIGYCQAEDHLLEIARGLVGTHSQLAATFGGQQNLAADFNNAQFR